MTNEFENFSDFFTSVPDVVGDKWDTSESKTVTFKVFDMEKEIAELNGMATLAAGVAFLTLMSLFFWHYRGYTLKPNGWHKSGRYQFSLENGVSLMSED